MRKKVIAGNWKMNNDLKESKNLIKEIISGLGNKNYSCDIIICPPFTSLNEASGLIKGSAVRLGAQNMYYEQNGAYTGEISAGMLKSTGCEFVILGHSERRAIFDEKDELINMKLQAALKADLIPIFCIGETLEQRERDVTEEVVHKQLSGGLKDIPESGFRKIIIAYEPVWAIGTGKTATPDQAQHVHNYIRKVITDLYSPEAASSVIIQYGGSVKPDNAKELLSQNDIDGALVGGACLKANSFLGIIEAAS